MYDLYREYRDKAEFYLVYIKEAHPDDGWQMNSNRKAGVVYDSPQTLQERADIASDCIKDLEIPFPCLLDRMDNNFQKTYNGMPSRAIVIGKDGRITYASRPGPRGVEPEQIKAAVKALFR